MFSFPPDLLSIPNVHCLTSKINYIHSMIEGLQKELEEHQITLDEVQATMKNLFSLIDNTFVIRHGIIQTQVALISAAINLSEAYRNSNTTEEILKHALAELEAQRYVANGNKLN